MAAVDIFAASDRVVVPRRSPGRETGLGGRLSPPRETRFGGLLSPPRETGLDAAPTERRGGHVLVVSLDPLGAVAALELAALRALVHGDQITLLGCARRSRRGALAAGLAAGGGADLLADEQERRVRRELEAVLAAVPLAAGTRLLVRHGRVDDVVRSLRREHDWAPLMIGAPAGRARSRDAERLIAGAAGWERSEVVRAG